ncbi:PKD domain-containing protein [Massilia sp. SYSU DXS3249]
MLTRHASSAPRGWKLWCLAPAMLLAASSWDGGNQALAYPKTPPSTPVTTTYRIIPLWESNPITQPDINNRDQVAFTVAGPSGGAGKFYDGRRVLDIGTLGGTETLAFGVNDLGQVIGSSTINAQNNFHAFVWSQRTGIIDLGALPPGPGDSVAADINNAGQIVGASQVNGRNHAVLWSRKTGLLDLGMLPGTNVSNASAINEAGQVAGNSLQLGDVRGEAFLWSRATGMVGLGAGTQAIVINAAGQVGGTALNAAGLPVSWVWTPRLGGVTIGEGGTGSQVTDINDRGLAVGIDTATGVNAGYTWTRETGIRFLGNFAGGLNSIAHAVNNRGQVVGEAPAPGLGLRAFVWTRAEGLVDLNTRIPDAPPGLVLRSARDISENGAIVAESTSGLVLLVPRAVSHVAPVVGPIEASGPAVANRLLSLSAGFKDADLRDTHKANWSWGDGKQETGVVSAKNGTGSVSGQHVWRAPGTYTVRLTVTDSGGKSTTVTRKVVVSKTGG